MLECILFRELYIYIRWVCAYTSNSKSRALKSQTLLLMQSCSFHITLLTNLQTMSNILKIVLLCPSSSSPPSTVPWMMLVTSSLCLSYMSNELHREQLLLSISKLLLSIYIYIALSWLSFSTFTFLQLQDDHFFMKLNNAYFIISDTNIKPVLIHSKWMEHHTHLCFYLADDTCQLEDA